MALIGFILVFLIFLPIGMLFHWLSGGDAARRVYHGTYRDSRGRLRHY